MLHVTVYSERKKNTLPKQMWARTHSFPSLDGKGGLCSLSTEALCRFSDAQNNCFLWAWNLVSHQIKYRSILTASDSRNTECTSISSRFPEHGWISARLGKVCRPRVPSSYVKLYLETLAQLSAVSRIQQASPYEKRLLLNKACPFAIFLKHICVMEKNVAETFV